ncbi:FecR family protein [Sphingomonas sp.]|uniref:FecR family protein n=1 Tax=Sphingomonas sp. TaxID=28214 RepID=UPI0028A18117|nr:FecR domain-containing protein [Sphingomonas sp.]
MSDPRMLAAAEWVDRLDSADADTSARFEAWRADPANAAAWRAADAARLSAVALADHPDLLALRHAAVARAVRDQSYRARHRFWAMAAAACAVLAVPVLWTVRSDRTAGSTIAAQPVYRTDVGQRLAVTLPDGSRLTLNTASQVHLAYTPTERRLILDRGQALFEVAKHQSRPFVVVGGGQAVTAHGTAFDVRVRPGTTRVALIEGRVTVAPAARPRDLGRAMVVDDILTATLAGVSIRHVPGEAGMLASWSEGRLVFADQSLASAIAEMNRYTDRPITVVDPRAAALRISGSFRTGEIEPFLSALQSGFPVTVGRSETGAIRISYRS